MNRWIKKIKIVVPTNVMLLTASACLLVISLTYSATFLDSLNRGKEIILSNSDLSSVQKTTIPAQTVTQVADTQQTNGFRIQCLSVSLLSKAEEEKKKLEEKTKLPVYLVQSGANYKIFVGDFVNRQSADSTREYVRGLGYRDAWISAVKIKME